jgi:excisionase family DNA binding protein
MNPIEYPMEGKRMRRLLNINEAADYIGLSPNYIRDLIAKRRFPYKNISRGKKPVFRFDIKELDKYISTIPGMTTEELE